MENKNLNNEQARELKAIKDCTREDIEKDCVKVLSNLRKVTTKAKQKQASRTYYTITFFLVPGVCEKTINLELAEFVNITRSLNLRPEQAESKLGCNFNTWCRLSKGNTLDVQSNELRNYWLAEFIINKMVRKSVFLKELDIDNIGNELKFIERIGSIDNVEGSVEMPIFLDF